MLRPNWRLLFMYLNIFRRGLKLRGRKLCDAADSPAAEAEEEEEDKKDGEEVEERESKEEEQKEEEKRGEGQVDTDDCEVCPGTEAPHFLWTVI